MKAGALPDQKEFARQWELDREFQPIMVEEEREQKYANWQRAVACSLGY